MSEKVITKIPRLFSPGHIDPVVRWVRKLGIRPDLLPGLEGEFSSLVKAEGEILKGGIPLGANCDYEKQRGKSKWTEPWPAQPGFVFCDGPEDMYQQPRKDFWRKFTIVANKAGRALGSRPDIAPCDFFVYCLFIYLLKIKSHRLRYANHTGGIINELCEAARDFIAEIAQMEEAGEFESKQNSEKKDQPAEATDTAKELRRSSVQAKPHNKGGRPKGKDEELCKRNEFIAAKKRVGLRSSKICRELDDAGLATPGEDWPTKWVESYRKDVYRKRIYSLFEYAVKNSV